MSDEVNIGNTYNPDIANNLKMAEINPNNLPENSVSKYAELVYNVNYNQLSSIIDPTKNYNPFVADDTSLAEINENVIPHIEYFGVDTPRYAKLVYVLNSVQPEDVQQITKENISTELNNKSLSSIKLGNGFAVTTDGALILPVYNSENKITRYAQLKLKETSTGGTSIDIEDIPSV